MKKNKKENNVDASVKFLRGIEIGLTKYYQTQHSESIKRGLRAKKQRTEETKKEALQDKNDKKQCVKHCKVLEK